MTQPLYERLGGADAVIAAVDILYDKLLADPLLQPFFEGIDMQKQAQKQIAFMSYAFDGPAEYNGRDLRAAHADLVAKRGLGDRHFDQVAMHLQATLLELGVEPELVEEAIGRVASLRDQVLNR